jgi:DNA-binding XRE family transcriptional regulator
MLQSMGRKPKDQEELADAVGVHYQTVGYIERGEYSPSLVLALQIAKVLGTPVENIFSLEEEEN